MSIRVPEPPSGVVELHDEAITDGRAMHASVIQRLAGNAMRLVCRPEPVLQLVFDSSDQGEDSEGGLLGYGAPRWAPITPWCPVTKRPGIVALDSRLIVLVPAGEVVLFGMETRAEPWDPGAADGDPRVVSATGTGAWQVLTLDGVPCQRGPGESLRLWARGVPNTATGSTGTHGSPNTGSVARTYPDGIGDTSATWVTDIAGVSYAEGGHWVEFADSAGVEVIEGRWIIQVPDAQTLIVWPPLSDAERRDIRAAVYTIRTLPTWQVANLAVYTAARTA